ncbi:hypothetical protein PO909_002552 [Leuciscus waleckii]
MSCFASSQLGDQERWWQSTIEDMRRGKIPFPPQGEKSLERYAQGLEEKRNFTPEVLLNSYFIAGLNVPPPLAERQGLIRRPFREVVDHVRRRERQDPTRTLSVSALPAIPESRVLATTTLGNHVLATSTSTKGPSAFATDIAGISVPILGPAMASAPRSKRRRKRSSGSPSQSLPGSVPTLQVASVSLVHAEVDGRVTKSSPVPAMESSPVHAEVDGRVTKTNSVPAKESRTVHAEPSVVPPVPAPLRVATPPVLGSVSAPLLVAATSVVSPVVSPITPVPVVPRPVPSKTVPHVSPPRTARFSCPQSVPMPSESRTFVPPTHSGPPPIYSGPPPTNSFVPPPPSLMCYFYCVIPILLLCFRVCHC